MRRAEVWEEKKKRISFVPILWARGIIYGFKVKVQNIQG